MISLAAVLADQTLPPSLVAPLAISGAVLAALLLLAFLAFRPGGPPALLKRGLALAVGLAAVWAGAVLTVSLRVRALHDDLAGRQAAFSGLASQVAAGLEGLSNPVGACAESLEVGAPTSLVGYLVVPPRAGVPREDLPRPGYPRLLVPTDAGAVVITSVPAPPRSGPSLPALLGHAAMTPPWRWSALVEAPANPLTVVRYLVVASVRSFDPHGRRLDAALRVLPATGGPVVCEGTYSVQVPPGAGESFPLVSALDAAAFAPMGRAGGTTFVDHVQRYAPRVPAVAAGP